ncbi:Fic family protein [Quadrisphaera sp. INWT6]|uniref:Fic family protein n=1 Tax=Quadrisphaera sp. INWT6 TaxID=2596917 RepID=UPI00189201AF|nr:Fic family protein [Quadrisphaera sp. INWT6]MBF5081482.1 Fic family protein [Quadrisphaera sp. INWT6]
MAVFQTPDLDLDDHAVIEEVHAVRLAMAASLRAPRRWTGGLRRTTQARAIQGSNSIEGYSITDQDAVAAVDDDQPLTADQRTWAEILGYRRVLTYVLGMAPSDGFRVDAMTLRSMHFMLLEHDLPKGPGQFRPGAVYVHDDSAGRTVYEGPPSDLVPGLVDELVEDLDRDRQQDPLVRGAMAHLNLVMVHPFKDGNGRMARALQTLVLAQDRVLEPTFSSIEEWLGSNTADYYRVLAVTGRGAWNPGNDAHLWLKFNLRAHHMQAHTLRSRIAEAEQLWERLDALVAQHHLPERVADALFDAARGLRVQRPTYVKRLELEERTATRDLARLVDAGLLTARGQTRGRYYLAGEGLTAAYNEVRSGRRTLEDPYPGLIAQLRAQD